jgi:hypothetical protein
MSKTRKELLEQYADPSFQVPDTWTKESLSIVECKRLSKNALMARYACDVKRRLGPDATAAELSSDKKLARRIAHTYLTLWGRFVLSKHAPFPAEICPVDLHPPRNWQSLYVRAAIEGEIRSAAATVIWPEWWEELQPRIQARRMVIASFALLNDQPSWGYRYVISLSDELHWVGDKLAAWSSANERIASR